MTQSSSYHIHSSDLPVSCPPPKASLWNAHPKIYLPIGPKNPQATCPYCGQQFILKLSPLQPHGSTPCKPIQNEH